MNPNLGLKLNGYIKASYAGHDTQAANPQTEGREMRQHFPAPLQCLVRRTPRRRHPNSGKSWSHHRHKRQRLLLERICCIRISPHVVRGVDVWDRKILRTDHNSTK